VPRTRTQTQNVPAHRNLLARWHWLGHGKATVTRYAFAQVRLPACFKVGTSKPAPEQREKSESAPLIDADLPLHNFKSVTLFMRRRSAWLCVAGAVLAYFAFLPPLLVIVPLMTEQFCTEWHAGIGVVMTLQSTGAIAPECTTGWQEFPRGAAHDTATGAPLMTAATQDCRHCRTAGHQCCSSPASVASSLHA